MEQEHLQLFVANKHMLLVEAMQKIDQNAKGLLFVIDEKEVLCGTISDGDIRRWILKTGNLDVVIEVLMNKEPKYLYMEEAENAFQYMQEYTINAVPILDQEKHIQNIIFRDSNKNIHIKNKEILKHVPVIIMAGGKGTRLYPYTKILPKPLIPIGDIPIIERIIDSFYDYGINEFYITVNYRKNMIMSYFNEMDRDYRLHYVEEEIPLGTAGSIQLISDPLDFPVFVTNCDILIRADFADLYAYHKKSGNAITLVTALKSDTIPYGVVYTKDNGEIKNIEEKPCRSYLVNTGMYVLNPDMIHLIPSNTAFHMTDLVNKAIQNNYKVGTYPVSEDSFLDMGELEEMKRMEEKLNLHN